MRAPQNWHHGLDRRLVGELFNLDAPEVVSTEAPIREARCSTQAAAPDVCSFRCSQPGTTSTAATCQPT